MNKKEEKEFEEWLEEKKRKVKEELYKSQPGIYESYCEGLREAFTMVTDLIAARKHTKKRKWGTKKRKTEDHKPLNGNR